MAAWLSSDNGWLKFRLLAETVRGLSKIRTREADTRCMQWIMRAGGNVQSEHMGRLGEWSGKRSNRRNVAGKDRHVCKVQKKNKSKRYKQKEVIHKTKEVETLSDWSYNLLNRVLLIKLFCSCHTLDQHLDNALSSRCQESAEEPEFSSWTGTSIWSRLITGSCSPVYTRFRPGFCWLTDRLFQMVQSQVSREVCWLFKVAKKLRTTVLNSSTHKSVVSLRLITIAVSTCWERSSLIKDLLLPWSFFCYECSKEGWTEVLTDQNIDTTCTKLWLHQTSVWLVAESCLPVASLPNKLYITIRRRSGPYFRKCTFNKDSCYELIK